MQDGSFWRASEKLDALGTKGQTINLQPTTNSTSEGRIPFWRKSGTHTKSAASSLFASSPRRGETHQNPKGLYRLSAVHLISPTFGCCHTQWYYMTTWRKSVVVAYYPDVVVVLALLYVVQFVSIDGIWHPCWSVSQHFDSNDSTFHWRPFKTIFRKKENGTEWKKEEGRRSNP